jgi:hypothetical protein
MGVLAYLDPGAGSMIAGAVAAGAAGAAVAARVGWRRVTGKFSKKSDADAETEDPVAEPSSSDSATEPEPLAAVDQESAETS